MNLWELVYYAGPPMIALGILAMLVSTLIDWMEDNQDKEELQDLKCLLKGENHGCSD